jgi:hypothetical protein
MLSPRPSASRYCASNAIPEFWESLALFWDEDRINKWYKTIFTDPENPDIGVERCFNLISLSPDAHDMWNNGMLALKPLHLSRNRKKLIVQVFLQAPGNYKINSRIDLLTEPTSSEGLEGPSRAREALAARSQMGRWTHTFSRCPVSVAALQRS